MSALDPLLEAHFRYRYGGAKQRDNRSTTYKCTSEAEKEERWLQRLYFDIAINRQKIGENAKLQGKLYESACDFISRLNQ